MGRILMVDDDMSMLVLVRHILSSEGYEVLIAEDSRTAMRMLEVYRIDLVIADIMMPHLNGFQFANLLKSNPEHRGLKLAFLTAKCQSRDVIKAKELGADFYVTKPIQQDDFVSKIRKFFAENPAQPHPQIKLRKPQGGEALIHMDVDVVSISDFGVEILTNRDLEIDQTINLSLSIFHEIPLKSPLMKVIWGRKEKEGVFRIGLAFADMELEAVRKLQKWIAYRKLKRSA